MHQLVIKLERRLIAMDLLHHRRRTEKLKEVLKDMEKAEILEEMERGEIDKVLHGQSEIKKTEE